MSEAIYNQIRQLVELQKIDDKIFAVTQKLESAPRALEELQRNFTAVESRRNHILDKLSHLEDQRKRLSNEIDEDSSRIKKSKNKLMQVGNTREYQAMMREMDSIEKINRNREEEKMALMEELQNQNDALAEIDKEYNEIKNEMDSKRAGLDDTLRQAEDEREKLNRIRANVGKDIPKPIFMRYEFIRQRLEHPVIVAVDDGICSGCHIAIPPQSFIELQAGQQILSCPNCQRLIFWREHFDCQELPEKPQKHGQEEILAEKEVEPEAE